MSDDFDLNAYLRRIGYHPTPAVDVQTLRGLAVAHVAALPFENLNPWLGTPVLLSVDALQRKLVQGGRGGYCFEQNGLFAAALRAIGFEVQTLIARVLWNRPEDAITAQTHMLLQITLDGESWLADVGFGALALAGALRLEPDIEQPTALEPFRLLLRRASRPNADGNGCRVALGDYRINCTFDLWVMRLEGLMNVYSMVPSQRSQLTVSERTSKSIER